MRHRAVLGYRPFWSHRTYLGHAPKWASLHASHKLTQENYQQWREYWHNVAREWEYWEQHYARTEPHYNAGPSEYTLENVVH